MADFEPCRVCILKGNKHMLKIKQEKFCQELVMCGSQSEAYRVAYNSENMQPATIHSRASELMKNSKVRARVSELQAAIAEKNAITADDLLQELEQARQLALLTRQPSAMITATMGKSKILGFDKIILSDDKDNPLQFKINQMSEADLMEEAGRIAERLRGRCKVDFRRG
ncbi:MAG: terminase small subunit [Methylobacter sp.]|nr:terminase small subunit [Methylobacter sp.]